MSKIAEMVMSALIALVVRLMVAVDATKMTSKEWPHAISWSVDLDTFSLEGIARLVFEGLKVRARTVVASKARTHMATLSQTKKLADDMRNSALGKLNPEMAEQFIMAQGWGCPLPAAYQLTETDIFSPESESPSEPAPAASVPVLTTDSVKPNGKGKK